MLSTPIVLIRVYVIDPKKKSSFEMKELLLRDNL